MAFKVMLSLLEQKGFSKNFTCYSYVHMLYYVDLFVPFENVAFTCQKREMLHAMCA